MASRANAKADTEKRILAAAEQSFMESPYHDVRLEDIAARAGVSSPTVIHRFGSKEALLAAAAMSWGEQIRSQRGQAPAGNLAGAVANLVQHYELWGDTVVHMLAQEAAVPVIRELTDAGRAVHVAWVERTFAGWLPRQHTARRRRVAQLVALMDVYVWKVLRRDRGLSQAEAEVAMREMVAALLEES